MNRKKLFRSIWLVGAILLFFCCFGRTDSQGFHSGWLVATRPGWLWLTILVYLVIVGGGYVVVHFLSRPHYD